MVIRKDARPVLCLIALGAIAASACGSAQSRSTPAAQVQTEQRTEADESGAPVCNEISEPEHPSHTSDTLTLNLREHGSRAGMVTPPFEFEANTREDLANPVEMELTIHDPLGRTTTQRFSYSNMHEVCDPYCLPSGPVNNCPPRRCHMERLRQRPERIDRAAYEGSRPGRYTFVLHRLDNGERVSVERRLFEGEMLEGEACEALPLAIGDFRRDSCRRGIVPMGTSTNFWGIKAVYVHGNCRANAFALPISHQTRTVFDEGPYNAAPENSFPEGSVHEARLAEGVVVRAWLSHHHFYVLAGKNTLPGYDPFTQAFLSVHPDISGPLRETPSCEGTGEITELSLPPTTMSELGEERPGFTTYFEGNRPAGLRVRFHNEHALARAGLRRFEIVHSVNGTPIEGRRDVQALLGPLTSEGEVEIVLSRQRMTHARCIRLTLSLVSDFDGDDAAAVAVPDPDGSQGNDTGQDEAVASSGPRRGRHCRRHSATCWDCVEFMFPAAVECGRRCRRGDICVETAGEEQCLAPTRICCQQPEGCDIPPGCPDVAHSCASDGGPNQRCTFLNTCAQELPQ